MKYSEKELWAFVHRADDKKKIAVAERWLRKHFEGNNDLFDRKQTRIYKRTYQIRYREIKEMTSLRGHFLLRNFLKNLEIPY